MTQKKINWISDHGATIMGILVAVAQAWITIDWKSFDITKEYPKLVLSAIIAIGGYVSTIKLKQK
jgi:hypothetical protein